MATSRKRQHNKRHARSTPRKYIIRRTVVAVLALSFCVATGLSACTASPEAFRVTHQQEIQLALQQQAAHTKANTKAQQSESVSKQSQAKTQTAKPASKETQEERAIAALEAPISAKEHDQILQAARQAALDNGKDAIQMSYCVASRGNVGSLDGFKNTIFRVLNNPKGWPRAGVIFSPADGNGTCEMTITLAAPDQVPTFSSYCSVHYSCRVGNDVIVNKERWDSAVEPWFAKGGVLSQYRTMALNHEVGHRLGHIDNETTCSGNNVPAPLMQEQSMHLDTCTPNAWPLDNELWSTYTGPGT